MTEITLPLPIVGLACFVLAVILIAKLPVSRYTGKPAPLEALMKSMGLARLNAGVFFLILLLWATLFTLLCLGVALSIWGIITTPPPAKDDIWPWRFALANLVATTGVLGAVVALPFTLIRLNLTHEQTRTATESLFNDKINAATTDLYSQREVTRWTGDEASNGWEDDVIRRNAAIDRLEGLVEERPDTAQRVARMLGVYVRELSRQYAPQKPPDIEDYGTLQKWARNLKPARSDMEKAVQTLGRLAKIPGVYPDHAIADLSGANLQRFTLPDAALEKANLSGARFDPSTSSAPPCLPGRR